MPDRYECRLFDWSGSLLHVFDDWEYLTVERRINDYSTHIFSLPANDSRVPSFVKDYFFQVRRRNEYIADWQQEYIGFHRSTRFQVTSTGKQIFVGYGRSLEDVLRRRVLGYSAPYEKSGPADDVMKAFVRENAGIDALTANARHQDAVAPAFFVDADLGLGPNWIGERSNKPLLDVLQEIATATGVDFGVDVNLPGIGGMIFRTTYPSPDRTATQFFGVELGNIADLDYTISSTEEINSVIVVSSTLGTFPFNSAASTQTPWALSELVRDANNEASPTALSSLAATELQKGAATESIALTIIQTPSSQYGREYFFGDRVSIRIGPLILQKKIVGVSINQSANNQKLAFSFADLEPQPLTNQEAIIQGFRNIIKRMKILELIP